MFARGLEFSVFRIVKIQGDFRCTWKSRCVGLSWICFYNNGVATVLTLGLDFIDWLCFVVWSVLCLVWIMCCEAAIRLLSKAIYNNVVLIMCFKKVSHLYQY